MNMVQFDTLKYANKLKLSGVSEEQAEGMTEAMKQVLESKDIATKWDVKALEASTTVAIKELESFTRLELEKIRGEIGSAKVEMIKWTAGMLVAQSGFIIAAIKLL